MQKWEYLVRQNLDESALNSYGKDGWELITAIHNERGWHYYFKRPMV